MVVIKKIIVLMVLIIAAGCENAAEQSGEQYGKFIRGTVQGLIDDGPNDTSTPKRPAYPPASKYNNPVRHYEFTNEVFDELEGNKARFLRDVNGKFIRVKGYIGDNSINPNYVTIEGFGVALPPTISCYARDDNKHLLAELNQGMTIHATGIAEYSDSILGDDIDIKQCIFTAAEDQSGTYNLLDFVQQLGVDVITGDLEKYEVAEEEDVPPAPSLPESSFDTNTPTATRGSANTNVLCGSSGLQPPEEQLALVGSLITAGDYKNALYQSGDMINSGFTTATTYYNRGYANSMLGRHRDAILDFTCSIKLKPKGDSYSMRALSYQKEGNISQACSDINEASNLKTLSENHQKFLRQDCN